MSPSIRHTKLKILAYTDGKPSIVHGYTECDYGEIHEDYDIVHPVSMVEEIRKNRPKDGYTNPFYGAMGKTMVSVSRVNRIESDGTILIDFKIKKHMDVHIMRCLGAMFQEKLNTYGGGLFRYIPKTKPYVCDEGTFDFQHRTLLSPISFQKTNMLHPNSGKTLQVLLTVSMTISEIQREKMLWALPVGIFLNLTAFPNCVQSNLKTL